MDIQDQDIIRFQQKRDHSYFIFFGKKREIIVEKFQNKRGIIVDKLETNSPIHTKI